MNKIALSVFSYFDTGKNPSGEAEPERFYHGFVLGLLVELSDRYAVRSNRESGFGRYDVLLEPRSHSDNAIILEFKVRSREGERTLEDTVKAALSQIASMKYATELEDKGFEPEKIRCYGFAFDEKRYGSGDMPYAFCYTGRRIYLAISIERSCYNMEYCVK